MSFKEDFINKHKQDVFEATYGTKIFPSVKMAQMILESGWGKDAPVKYANNYFGIKKGSNWNGPTVDLKTSKDAKKVNTFRKYNNAVDSIKDHTSFLIKNPRYKTAGVFDAKTPEEQVKAIAKGGYAESEKYVDTIMSVINSNNLKKLDEEAKSYKPKTEIKPVSNFDFKIVVASSLGIVAIYVLYKLLNKQP